MTRFCRPCGPLLRVDKFVKRLNALAGATTAGTMPAGTTAAGTKTAERNVIASPGATGKACHSRLLRIALDLSTLYRVD